MIRNIFLQVSHFYILEILQNSRSYLRSLVVSDILHVRSYLFFFSVAPPRITKRSKEKVTVIEGKSVVLVCEAEGFPVPIITWTKNGKLLLESHNKTNYTIHDTSKEDAGKYKCEASNTAGRASYTCTVEVTGKGVEFYKVTLPPFNCSRREKTS